MRRADHMSGRHLAAMCLLMEGPLFGNGSSARNQSFDLFRTGNFEDPPIDVVFAQVTRFPSRPAGVDRAFYRKSNQDTCWRLQRARRPTSCTPDPPGWLAAMA